MSEEEKTGVEDTNSQEPESERVKALNDAVVHLVASRLAMKKMVLEGRQAEALTLNDTVWARLDDLLRAVPEEAREGIENMATEYIVEARKLLSQRRSSLVLPPGVKRLN